MEQRVCWLGENRDLLFHEAVLVSYRLLGQYSARQVAMKSLKAVIHDEWGWFKVWKIFAELHGEIEDDYEPINVQEELLGSTATSSSGANFSAQSSVHIQASMQSMFAQMLSTQLA